MASEGIVGGNPPSVNLWIGNVLQDVSEAELKALLEKFGEIDSITMYPSRNYAFVYFTIVEDAKSAKEGLQGYLLHGSPLKIEYARPAKRCKSLHVAGISPSIPKDELERTFLKFGQIQECRFLRDGTTALVDYVQLEDAIEALKNLNGKRFGGSVLRVDYLRSQPGRRQPLLPIGSYQGDFFVSNVLLIRYPPSVIIEEDMLHNAMILFGEIEKIKTFSDRNCALVEFRSAEEARCAKEVLQGKLFSDPRISIDFAASEYPGARGLVDEYSIHPAQVDILGLNHIIPQGAGLLPIGIRESDLYVHPALISHNAFKPSLHGHEFMDLAAVHKLQNGGSQMLIGEPNWISSSPSHGIATSTKQAFNLQKRPPSGGWDVHDAKRSRFEPAFAHPGVAENQDAVEREYGSHSISNIESIRSLTRSTARKRHRDGDCIWRGLIAKGGTPVCQARCVAIGEGLDADIPKVVNCSARTTLELLAKHYEDAIGFDVVFFLPDSEDDFAPYTEFLRYLGSKDRAGVAKFDDGTTLFLVPPSNFLYKVLKVSGPERLYGVVLKFPSVAPDSSASNPWPTHLSQPDPRNTTKLPTGYGNVPLEERRPSPYNSAKPVLVEDPVALPRPPPLPPLSASGLPPAQPVSTTAAVSQVGLTLTPELIATLTSLLPGNAASGLQPNPTATITTSNVVSGTEPNVGYWKPEHHVQDQNGQVAQQQQLGGQFSSQFQHLQAVQASPVVSNPVNTPVNSYSQIGERFTTLTQGAVSSFSHAAVNPVPNGSYAVAQGASQSYQLGTYDALKGQGQGQVSDDVQRFYGSSVAQQPVYNVGVPSQVHAAGSSMSQPYNPLQPENDPVPSQSYQTPGVGVAQGNSETEADKNERYKTTLLFAANLLSQIQQPSGSQPRQGAGS